MENKIKQFVETIKKQYQDWKSFRTKICSSKENYDEAEKIDQIQKYYYYFTENNIGVISKVFHKINNPELKIEKLLTSGNILYNLYNEGFCSIDDPPNTLYWEGIEQLFIVYCNEILKDDYVEEE
jgi:hypothetical protein